MTKTAEKIILALDVASKKEALGLVEEIEPSRFSLTATGAQLRSNVPGFMRNLALMFGGERAWRSWGELLHSVRTGESATRHVFGVGSFEYLAANPEQAVIFNERWPN